MAWARDLHCTWEGRWSTISPSGRVDVVICGSGGTRSRGPYQSLTNFFFYKSKYV
ncbi:unnamed protein product [Musa acuminata subsp. burmannicoides]